MGTTNALRIEPGHIMNMAFKAKILVGFASSLTDPSEIERVLCEALLILEKVESARGDVASSRQTKIGVLIRLARMRGRGTEERRGFYERALTAALELDRLKPDDPNTIMHEIEAFVELGRNEEAVAAAQRILENERNFSRVCRCAAEFMLQIKRHDLAIALVDKSVQAEPSNLRNRERLAEMYEAAENFFKAEKTALEGIEYFEERSSAPAGMPHYSHLIVILIRVRLKMGKSDKAQSAALRALSIGVPSNTLVIAYRNAGFEPPRELMRSPLDPL